MSKSKNLSDNRIFWLDAARSFAIVSITLNHAINRTFDMHNDTMLEFQTIPLILSVVKAFIQVISRIGVPIFLMISGSLLLNRDYSDDNKAKRFYKHNWLSLLITAEAWYFIIFLYKSLASDSVLRTRGALAALMQLISNQLFINQDTFTSMWYMPMILCVYLIIPFIAIGIKTIKSRFILIPAIIAFLSAFLFPNINTGISLIRGVTGENYIRFGLSISNLFSMYVIYIVLGYWIYNGGLKAVPKSALFLGLVISLLCTVAYQLWAFSRPGNYNIEYNSTGIVVISVLLFECFRRYSLKLFAIKRPIILLSEISFGIYFVHVCIMEGLKAFFNKDMGYIPYFLLLEIASFIGSVLAIQILRKSKNISKILFRI